MQNVLKSKNMYVFERILSYFALFSTKLYVLDYSESIDMHIEKLPIFSVSAKKAFCRTAGIRKIRLCPQLLGFFLRLPLLKSADCDTL